MTRPAGVYSTSDRLQSKPHSLKSTILYAIHGSMLYIVKKQQHWEDKHYVSGQKSSAWAEPPEECSVCLDIVSTCKHHQKCCKYHVLGQTADEWGGCRSFRKFQNVLKMAKAKESVFYYTFCVLYRIIAFINRLWWFKNSYVLWIFYNLKYFIIVD